jgi:hypothetical protein
MYSSANFTVEQLDLLELTLVFLSWSRAFAICYIKIELLFHKITLKGS